MTAVPDRIPVRRDAEPHVDAWRWPTFGATLLRRPRFDLLWRRRNAEPRYDAGTRWRQPDGAQVIEPRYDAPPRVGRVA